MRRSAAAIALVGMAGGAAMPAAGEGVVAFTTSARPLTGAVASGVEVYELDTGSVTSFLEGAAAGASPGDPRAEGEAMRRALATPAGKRAMARATRAGEARRLAREAGIEWLPAVVRGGLVVYGVADMARAVAMLEEYAATGAVREYRRRSTRARSEATGRR